MIDGKYLRKVRKFEIYCDRCCKCLTSTYYFGKIPFYILHKMVKIKLNKSELCGLFCEDCVKKILRNLK